MATKRKDPVVEFVRWAQAAAPSEVDLVLKLVKASREEVFPALARVVRARRGKKAEPEAPPA